MTIVDKRNCSVVFRDVRTIDKTNPVLHLYVRTQWKLMHCVKINLWVRWGQNDINWHCISTDVLWGIKMTLIDTVHIS